MEKPVHRLRVQVAADGESSKKWLFLALGAVVLVVGLALGLEFK